MAESVVVVDDEVRSPAPAAASIFFCHSCGVEIERVTEVIVCVDKLWSAARQSAVEHS